MRTSRNAIQTSARTAVVRPDEVEHLVVRDEVSMEVIDLQDREVPRHRHACRIVAPASSSCFQVRFPARRAGWGPLTWAHRALAGATIG